SRRRHTRSSRDWSSDVCSSDLLIFQSLFLDLFGLGMVVGSVIAAYKRYVVRPPRLTHGVLADGWFLASLFLIGVTGFMVEGLRKIGRASCREGLARQRVTGQVQ